MGALPTLRMLLYPEPGFGLEAKIPMGKQVRCYFAAEAYIQGNSAVRFGIELSRLPYLRLQVAPETTLSIRVPILRLTEFKKLHAGATLTLYDRGKSPLSTIGHGDLLNALRAFVFGIAELQHRSTVLSTILDANQRRTLNQAVRELRAKREVRDQRRVGERRRTEKGFKPPEMPPLDPRQRADPFERLREQLKERYGDQGIVRGSLPPDTMDGDNVQTYEKGMFLTPPPMLWTWRRR